MMLESLDATNTISRTSEIDSNEHVSTHGTEETSTFASSELDYRAYHADLLNDTTFPAFAHYPIVLERKSSFKTKNN